MRTSPALLIILAVCLVTASGCRRSEQPTTSPEIAVQVITAKSRAIADVIVASGAIEAVNKAEIAFLAAGRTLSVEVEDGAEVKKNQILARLDPADYQQALAIAEAKLAEVRSRHERLSKLYELGSLTATDFEKIDAGLKEATGATELARRQLAYTELRAPFDGIVVKHGIAVGVVVAPGLPVFTVLAPSPVRACVSVSEIDARRVQLGQSVEVQVPASGKQVNTGKIEAIHPQADVLSRSFTVNIRLEDAAPSLRHGNVVIAHIRTGMTHNAITVPPLAVQKFADGSLFVWLVDPARKTAIRQVIETGSLQTSEVEVTTGLKPGDQIIFQVPHTLFEGTPINPIVIQ